MRRHRQVFLFSVNHLRLRNVWNTVNYSPSSPELEMGRFVTCGAQLEGCGVKTTESVCERNKELARWDLQRRQWELKVPREASEEYFQVRCHPSACDWLLLPSDSWQSLSTRPISGEKKKAVLFSYPQPGLSGTDLFNCKETLSSTPGTPEQGRNCTYPPFSFFFFTYSFSPRFSFSTQDKLFSLCLIQQKAWKCSALSLCLALKEKEDDEMAGEGDGDEEEQSEERRGRRGLLVIELRFCC